MILAVLACFLELAYSGLGILFTLLLILFLLLQSYKMLTIFVLSSVKATKMLKNKLGEF
jgi:hypothetical protein